MHNDKNELLNEVAAYYTEKLKEHGDTPRGVDWNGEESQLIRFAQLYRVIDAERPDFSINDLGCGYGALLDYLSERHPSHNYLGVDVSAAMIRAASERYADVPRARFLMSAVPDQVADYSVASGIFNVRQERSDDEWFDQLLDRLFR
jgi:trans-aconitate methyltransferase